MLDDLIVVNFLKFNIPFIVFSALENCVITKSDKRGLDAVIGASAYIYTKYNIG